MFNLDSRQVFWSISRLCEVNADAGFVVQCMVRQDCGISRFCEVNAHASFCSSVALVCF